jgi:16S rRNA processing protein RimM
MSNPPQNKPPAKRRYGRPRAPGTPADRTPPDAVPTMPPSGPTNDDEWIVVGHIVAPFGLQGEVKLISQTDFPERLADHKTLYLGPQRLPYRLLSAHPHGGVILLRFATINDMTAAETLRGLVAAIPAREAAPLATDQYYIHDLIGLRAVHVNGAELGTVADVLGGAAQDLLVVRRVAQPDVLVPFVAALVPAVDLAARTVTIDPPAGLFDDEWTTG